MATLSVISQVYFALHYLDENFLGEKTTEYTGTSALIPYTPQLLQTVLQVAHRKERDKCNLHTSMFEALKLILLKLLPAIIDRLRG